MNAGVSQPFINSRLIRSQGSATLEHKRDSGIVGQFDATLRHVVNPDGVEGG